jgi:hypothetical protein
MAFENGLSGATSIMFELRFIIGCHFCADPEHFSFPFSHRELSKNRRVSAPQTPYYHVLMGMQEKKLIYSAPLTGTRRKPGRQANA